MKLLQTVTMQNLPGKSEHRKLETRRARLQAYVLFLMVFSATIAAVGFADRQRSLYEEEITRSLVSDQLSVIRAGLEGRISGNVNLIEGLVAALEADPGMTTEHFVTLASKVLRKEDNIRYVSAAPDMVVRMVYPPSYNDLIGFDFRKRSPEHGPAFLAAQSRKVNLSGPVALGAGGKALVANLPVLIDQPGDKPGFWGVVTAKIDLERMFEDAGLAASNMPFGISISRRDAHGEYGAPFFGPADVMDRNPVRMTVKLGQERWLLAAAPLNGWQPDPGEALTFRLILLLVAAAILVPVLWATRLMGERHRALQNLEESSEHLRMVSNRLEIALDTSRVGIWEHDVPQNLQIWDERVRMHFGIMEVKPYYTYEDWRALVHPDDLEDASIAYLDAVRNNRPYSGQYRIIVPGTGEIRHIRAYGRLIDARPGHERLLGVDWDITEDVRRQEDLRAAREEAEAQNRALENARRQMEYNAFHDALTGLPNRRYLDQKLAESDAEEIFHPLTILHLDLDRFKEINDTLGHAAGDAILRHAAAVLRQASHPRDLIARIGGDEFVIVSRNLEEHGYFDRLTSLVIHALSEPLVFEGQECRAGVSIGIATQASPEENPQQVLMNADIALYEAKKRGRGRAEFFSDTLRAQVINTRQTADEILRGLEQREFIPFFQPQFDAHTLQIDGIEALVRWQHPQRGLVGPDTFLKIAEDIGVIDRIDETVLEQALVHFGQWQAAGLMIPRVSVNISARRLMDNALIDKIRHLEIAPGSVCFELLESISFEEQDDQLVEITGRLKALGIDIEIDDFGTGHASIVNLLKLTPRRLKIDRQLIMPILTSVRERQLVASIIDIGRTCGIDIIAEGVETMEHAAMLRDMGCHGLQGYALARPMRARDLPDFARTHREKLVANPARTLLTA